MQLILLIIPAIVVVYLTGGRLSQLLKQKLQYKWLVLLAFLIQLIIFTGIPHIGILSDLQIGIIHVFSYILLLAFFAANIKVPGLTVLCVGTMLNTTVIVANGGFMPNMLIPANEIFNNVRGITQDTYLLFLADVIALPKWIPLPNAFSIGDVLIVIGMFAYLFINTRQPKPN